MEVIKKYLRRAFLRMAKNLFLSKKGFVVLSTFLLLGIFVPFEFANAGLVSWFVDVYAGALTSLPALAILVALNLILVLSNFLVLAAGAMLEAIIELPIYFTKCPPGLEKCFLDTAWSLMRDIVNMLLIIILVVIAFATMLKKEEFGAKKALLPLIAVALLVNFSKVIVGVVVDLSTVIMEPFLDQITGISAFTQSFERQKDVLVRELDLNLFKISEQFLAIFKTVTLVIFQLSYAFILTLYSVIFLVRYVALWLLTIFSPIALASFILPMTRKKIFNPWRDQLVSWSFIGVTAVFFLWLGKLFSNSVTTISGGASISGEGLSGDFAEFLSEIFPYIFLLIFLYVTFMLALKTNAMGANMIISQAKRLGAVAGMATGKFAGKMAMRGAMVGGRGLKTQAGKAGARWIRPGLQKIAPKIPIAKQWTPGHTKKVWAHSEANKRRLARQAGIVGEMDNKGKKIPTTGANWNRLTADQQKRVAQANRSKLAKSASAILGTGTRGAKRLASTPFKALTPEEQKALWSTVSFERLRKAKKGETEKAIKDFRDKRLDDPRQLRKTIQRETNLNKRLAAEILLLQSGNEESGIGLTSDERKGIAKKARAAGFEAKDIAPHLTNNDEVKAVYGDSGRQYDDAQRARISGAAKAIEDELKSLENVSTDAARSLLRTATNIHTKIAAIRKLSDDNALNPNEFKSIEESLKSFGQTANVLKRSLQFADPQDIPKIMRGMKTDDHMRIDPRIFNAGFEKQLQAWFENLTVDAYRQIMKSPALKRGLADKINNNQLNFSQNKNNVYAYHEDEIKRDRAFNTIS